MPNPTDLVSTDGPTFWKVGPTVVGWAFEKSAADAMVSADQGASVVEEEQLSPEVFEAGETTMTFANDEELWLALWKYREPLFQYAQHKTGDPHRAEDLVTRTIIQAHDNISLFRGGSLSAWLFKILHNLLIDEYRRQRAHGMISLDEIAQEGGYEPTGHLGAELDPEEGAIARVEAEWLRKLFDRALQEAPLSPMQRDVLSLSLEKIRRGQTDAWIAGILQISENAVRVHRNGAYARLRQWLLSNPQP